MASNKTQVILITSLIVLFGFGLRVYWSWNVCFLNQANQLNSAQYGYSQAILTIAQQAATCQQVPLMVGNETINIIWIDCLQQAPAAPQ